MRTTMRGRLLCAVGVSALCFGMGQAAAADLNAPAVPPLAAVSTLKPAKLLAKKSAVPIAPPSAQSNAAAPAPAPSSGEEIVVTARRRSESLKNVPAQVTAFTAQTIENKGIDAPRDFLSAVPSATLVETQNAGNAFIVLRGITQARNSEPSVAVVVDGVPETQPAQFNQELTDIQQIEVLKGPQGALYGRDAIGGAIVITTKQPTDEWEGRATAGYESGPGAKAQGVISGPLTDTFKVRAAVSFFDTDGHLDNVVSGKKADPVQDYNGRLSFLYQPSSDFTADLRLSADVLHTKALYFVVDNFGPPGPPFDPNINNPNDTHYPISNNNPGVNDRQLYDAALKLTWTKDYGTFTSISGYDITREVLTGDGYPFDPFGASRLAFDFNQSQFLNVKVWSQELRFTSPANSWFRWIAGGQVFGTQRFISTGNELDTGNNVIPMYKVPSTNPDHFGISFLADTQHQLAWAGYVDTSTSLTKALELSLNLRYDSDTRKNITDTPTGFLPCAPNPLTCATGLQRQRTWDDWQPQAILRYSVTPDVNVYASYSRGFRSGGFNQTGVGQAAAAANIVGVGDTFNQETADTYEAGFKSELWNRRLSLNGSVYKTIDRGAYFFVFIASNSTQNLGSIPRVDLTGGDIDLTANVTDRLSVNLGFAYTDSEIEAFPEPVVVGHEAPLVPKYTFNAAVQYLAPVTDGIDALFRVDYSRVGDMYFTIPFSYTTYPATTLLFTDPTPKARDPVDLVDARIGLQGRDWSITAWSKNLFDEKYNAEYSPGGFLWKGEPVRWGIDLTKKF